MELLDRIPDMLRPLLPTIGAAVVVTVSLFVAYRAIDRWLAATAHRRLYGQLAMLALTLAGLLVIILSLPISDSTRGQLLSLLGIVLSAAIALSSTSLIGNAMAGLMLRATRSFRAGDYLQVGEHFGRVSERGILHVEVQTVDRDLTTLPNLFLVGHPIKVVRSSGTIVAATVSLGYDVARSEVSACLAAAAAAAGLEDPFVQVGELGDYSVSYRVGGLLREVKQLISSRSELRERILDQLHGTGIEIVSPNFMNTRSIPEGKLFVPKAPTRPVEVNDTSKDLEALVFDKADQAEKTEDARERFKDLGERLQEIDVLLKDAKQDIPRGDLETERDRLIAERRRLEGALNTSHKADLEAIHGHDPDS